MKQYNHYYIAGLLNKVDYGMNMSLKCMVPVMAEVLTGSVFKYTGFLSERFSLHIGLLLPSPVSSLRSSSDVKQEIVS